MKEAAKFKFDFKQTFRLAALSEKDIKPSLKDIYDPSDSEALEKSIANYLNKKNGLRKSMTLIAEVYYH